MKVPPDGLFGIATPALRSRGGELEIESQAANGLRLWAEHFGRVEFGIRLLPEDAAERQHSLVWRPVREIASNGQITVWPLPFTYDGAFLRGRGAVMQRLAPRIADCRYRIMALGGWNGCWGRVACRVAMRHGSPFGVHLEGVHASVSWASASTFKQRMKLLALRPVTAASDRGILRQAAIVQCNGMDTLEHYQRYSSHPVLIHDVHTTEADLISPEEVQRKQNRAVGRERIQIRYLGRLIPLKGPTQWLRALRHAKDLGARFDAMWMGEGVMEQEFAEEIRRLQLSDCVRLLPFESDRGRVRKFLDDADVLMFTHLSLESSRVQKEALNRGVPIVGYRTAFAEELISTAGGGQMTPMGDPQKLGDAIAEVCRDNTVIADLIRRAATDGQRFTDARVFADRADSLRQAHDEHWARSSQLVSTRPRSATSTQ